VGKKMNIFLQGRQKNEHFFQSSGWAKKWTLFFKVRGGKKMNIF
jgi:hypothetical protein